MTSILGDAWVLVLTAWLLAPLRRGGYGLAHDMVFTPHQPFSDASVGLGSAAPRAVPLDALVAGASDLLGGAAVGRIALVLPLLAAGWGAQRLLGRTALPARLLAGGLAVWNPYVIERLTLGQWALLWCYAALPWLLLALRRARHRPVRALDLALVAVPLAAAAITPTGALIGLLSVLVVGLTRDWRRTGALLGVALLVQLPWLLPALTSTAGTTSDPAGVAVFGARSERPGGALLSLLGLGGIWSADVTPTSRGGLLGYLTTAAVVAGLLLGHAELRRRLGPIWPGVVVLAAGGFVLAGAAAVPPGAAVLRWAVRELPGAGLLRDGQKWLLPFVWLAVLSLAAALQRLIEPHRLPAPSRGVRPAAWFAPAVIGAAVAPLLLLPDAPSTLRVPLSPVHYPPAWTAVAARVTAQPAEVLVLPFASYRAFDWAPGRTVIDPAPRWLPVTTVVQDRLAVSGRLLAGEDRRAAELAAVLAGPGPLAPQLARRGIGWVLVEHDTPGPPVGDLSSLQPVLTEGSPQLYRVPGTVVASAGRPVQRAIVLGADLLVAALLAIALAVTAHAGLRSLLQSLHRPTTRGTSWAS